jgi:hypothetical protein
MTKRYMNKSVRFEFQSFVIIGFVLLGTFRPLESHGQQTTGITAKETADSASIRDGQHDFDFNFGTWRTHIQRLQNPLSGSTNWIKMEGTVTVRKVWGGNGQVEEIEADGPDGHWTGLTLFLYNPVSRQWSQTFASKSDGILQPPIIGEFNKGRGELYGMDSMNGRSILVRGEWTIFSAIAHKFEQAFSTDGGKTWETNFIGTLERVSQ